MYGVLCNTNDISLVKYFFEKNNTNEVIIFDIENLDIEKRKVKGILINNTEIVYDEFNLPDIIYNFSVQFRRRNIVKLRKLIEGDNFIIVNRTNRINQFLFQEILKSEKLLSKFILNCRLSTKTDLLNNIQLEDELILHGRKGLGKMFYLKRNNSSITILGNEMLNLKLLEAKSVLDNIIKNRRIIIYDAKGIKLNEKLRMSRVYLQKGKEGTIFVLISENKILDIIAIKAFETVSKFISLIGVGFVEFLVDEKSNPYILRLGGFDKKILDAGFQFYKNLEDYAIFLKNMR